MTRTLDTKYGPLVLTHYAGPTSAPGSIQAHDGKYPSAGYAIGRDPDERYVGCRISSPDLGYVDGRRAYDYLTINGVQYSADATFTLTADGWRQEFGSFGALTRKGGWLTDSVPDGAGKTWRTVISPAIIAALTADTIARDVAIDDARESFQADCLARAAMLRAEADRLDKMAKEPVA
jgi:hypothetical protein